MTCFHYLQTTPYMLGVKYVRCSYSKTKREKSRFFLFCHHYVPHMSSLKRKSQCHWWSQMSLKMSLTMSLKMSLTTSLMIANAFLRPRCPHHLHQLPSSTKYHQLPLLLQNKKKVTRFYYKGSAALDASHKCRAICVILTGDLYILRSLNVFHV